MSSHTLIQDAAGEIITYLETSSGAPAEGLLLEDVSIGVKTPSSAAFSQLPLQDTINATAVLGTAPDGEVTLEIPGTLGNTYAVAVDVPIGTQPLDVEVVGTTVTVRLSVVGGIPVAAENTAMLVADKLSNVLVDGFATASGTGSTPLTTPEGPYALSGGQDGEFTYLGDGFYSVTIDPVETSELGSLFLSFSGPAIQNSVASALIVASAVPSPQVITLPDTTVITGSIFDTGGSPVANASILAKILSVPTILDGFAVATELEVAHTDSSGFFTLELLTGAQVDVSIPSVNYRRTITVPVNSTNLFEIP